MIINIDLFNIKYFRKNDYIDFTHINRMRKNNGTRNNYSVTSSSKNITVFPLNGATGVINGQNVAATVPNGTVMNNLAAAFTASGANVAVGGTAQTSGTTANDFTPVNYVVTAADGLVAKYTVTVTVAPSAAK
ncbi:hypothetical protein [Burkholderia cepacia]|uniref:hypothetical protein n=1 Tax=Burkholderia cepacia TaxID=292 RepID=UPI00158BD9AC|nr:hypothetical protein [Burkholderia cepacia]